MQRLDQCTVAAADVHRLEWENRKRSEEIRELQKVGGHTTLRSTTWPGLRHMRPDGILLTSCLFGAWVGDSLLMGVTSQGVRLWAVAVQSRNSGDRRAQQRVVFYACCECPRISLP